MPTSGMLRRLALVSTDVSEERSASIIRVKRISKQCASFISVSICCDDKHTNMFADVKGTSADGILKDRYWKHIVGSRLLYVPMRHSQRHCRSQAISIPNCLLLSTVPARLDFLCKRRTLIYFRSLKLRTSRPFLVSPKPIIHSPDGGQFHILHGFEYPSKLLVWRT
jgi:hypothetical protein